MLEADRVAQLVLGGIDHPLLGVAVAGIEKVNGIELYIGMGNITGHGIGRRIGQSGSIVIIFIDGRNSNIGLGFIIDLLEGKSTGPVPLTDCRFCSIAQHRAAEVNIDRCRGMRPAGARRCISMARINLLGRFSRLLFAGQTIEPVIGENLGIVDGDVGILLKWRIVLVAPDKGTKGQ